MAEAALRRPLPEETETLARFCAEAFSISPGYFLRRWLGDPSPDSFGVVLELDREVLGYLHVFDRLLEAGDGALRCAGIGNVAVSGRHRGRGHARRLLDGALTECRDVGYDVSVLYTHLPDVYRPHGFELIPVREVLLPGGDGAGWVETAEGEDRRLYEQEYGGRPWTVRRDTSYWDARSGWLEAEGWRLLRHQEESGYCWVRPDAAGGRVDEAVGACAARVLRGGPGPGAWRCRVPLGAAAELPEAPPPAAVEMAARLRPDVRLDFFSLKGSVGWLTDGF
jgi:GNAT superfamily N-acetyltransferase